VCTKHWFHGDKGMCVPNIGSMETKACVYQTLVPWGQRHVCTKHWFHGDKGMCVPNIGSMGTKACVYQTLVPWRQRPVCTKHWFHGDKGMCVPNIGSMETKACVYQTLVPWRQRPVCIIKLTHLGLKYRIYPIVILILTIAVIDICIKFLKGLLDNIDSKFDCLGNLRN